MNAMCLTSLASLGIVLAVVAPPSARADASEGAGLQAVAEAMRNASAGNNAGWQNGSANLDADGTGYSVSYAGTRRGGAGRGLLRVVGTQDGKLIVEYEDFAPHSGALAEKR